MRKIVYLDVDGTILDQLGNLTEVNRETIIEIQKKGIYVALATGRNYLEIEKLSKELKIDQYLNYSICQNGAYITTTDQFRPSHLNLIDVFEARKLFDFLNQKGAKIFISNYKKQDFTFTNFEFEQKKIDQEVLPIVNLLKIDQNFDWTGISMISFECQKDDSVFFENYLKTNFEKIDYVCSQSNRRDSHFFMVNAKTVSKATTILKLNEELKIAESDTYFFGDGVNDVEAIKTFKNSFVPASAPDYVKVMAKNIINKSDEDGVGQKLKELFFEVS